VLGLIKELDDNFCELHDLILIRQMPRRSFRLGGQS
jgi:hypothetical protein